MPSGRDQLKSKLFPGAAVGNPIDILATGTPDHLRLCLEYCEEKFHNNLDVLLATTPGLVTMFEMYYVSHEKMQTYSKPTFRFSPLDQYCRSGVAAFLARLM